MAKAINHVYQGVDYDTSVQLIQKSRMRDAHNIRITGTSGDDFVAEAIPGNDLSIANEIGFNLPVDAGTQAPYIEIASASIKGVAFILSWNQVAGIGELGCFPSWNPNTNSFERRYRELRNWMPGNYPHAIIRQLETGVITQPQFDALRQPFRTGLFALQFAKATEMIVREDYDGSVNIYVCDGVNPDRVFNSGFDVNGVTGYNRRIYSQKSFDQLVRLYNETLSPCDITLAAIQEKGKLKCGNIFIHARYTDESFNKTSFHSSLGPIPIPASSLSEPFACKGGLSTVESNKSLLVNIDTSTLDRNYKYMELAVIRFTNDKTAEANIIDKHFDIQEMYDTTGGGTFQIEITGYEAYRTSVPEEIVNRKRSDEICESMVDFESRLFRGNTYEDNIDHDELSAFSLKISMKYFEQDMSLINAANGNGQNFFMTDVGYKNPLTVLNQTGHFGSETYPYAAVYLLRSGKLTPAYPVTGYDEIKGGTNSQGLYRFPRRNAFTTTNQVKLLGIRATIPYTQASAWIQQNVIGCYIVRGERIKNLVYQGLQVYAFDSSSLWGDGVYYSDGATSSPDDFAYEAWSKNRLDHATKKCAPFVWYLFFSNVHREGGVGLRSGLIAQIPWWWTIGKGGSGSRGDTWSGNNTGSDKGDQLDPIRSPQANHIMAVVVPRFYGVFSPDYCFSQKLVDRRYHIEVVGTWDSYNQNCIVDGVNLFSGPLNDVNNSMAAYFWEHRRIISDFSKRYAEAYGLLQWQAPDKNNFVSYYTEGSGQTYSDDDDADIEGTDNKDEFHFFYHYSNRKDKRYTKLRNLAMGLPPYIGLDYPSIQTGVSALSRKIVSLYNTDPDGINDISVGYVFSSNLFGKISELVRLTDNEGNIIPLVDHVKSLYKGDCWIGRTYIKTLGNPQYDVDRKEDNTDGEPGRGNNYFTFGFTTGIVTENAFNTDYRTTPDYNTATSQEPIKDAVQSFWPAMRPEDAKQFTNRMRSKESFVFNTGYNRVLDLLTFSGFDATLPLQKFHFPLRLNFSNKHISGSFIDSYRLSGIADHHDYENRLGDITGVRRTNHSLYTVHMHGIIRHGVEERAFQTNESGRIEIGSQTEVLHPRGDIKSNVFGAQHKTASFATDNALYVVDWQKRKIVIIDGDAKMLSDMKQVSSKLQNFIDAFDHRSDAFNQFLKKQVPASGMGIRIGYNREFKEVYFTFLAEQRMTLVFNEKATYFSGTRDEISPTYITINEDFFSRGFGFPQSFYLHDRPLLSNGQDNYLTFYGQQYDAYWEFVVNDRVDLMKVFQALEINANNQPFYKIIFETEFQQATHFPFTNNPEIYIEPVYKEGLWRLPVKRADVIFGSHYAVGTEMREKYLKVKIYYRGKKRQYIKSLLTEHIPTLS